MPVEIGRIAALFRYPVKSMAAERLTVADLGWHGVADDRRLALRRVDEHGGMPWLTASKLPELLLFTPLRRDESGHDGIPTHVRTPDGKELAVFGDELAAQIQRQHGAPVQMMQLKHGIYDEGSVSVISTETIDGIARLAGRTMDVRRFRPNMLVRFLGAGPKAIVRANGNHAGIYGTVTRTGRVVVGAKVFLSPPAAG